MGGTCGTGAIAVCVALAAESLDGTCLFQVLFQVFAPQPATDQGYNHCVCGTILFFSAKLGGMMGEMVLTNFPRCISENIGNW